MDFWSHAIGVFRSQTKLVILASQAVLHENKIFQQQQIVSNEDRTEGIRGFSPMLSFKVNLVLLVSLRLSDHFSSP